MSTPKKLEGEAEPEGLPDHGEWSLTDIKAHLHEPPQFWSDRALSKLVNAYERERTARQENDDRITRAKEILERMRSATSEDFVEMPYWADQVLKILNGEKSVEEC